MTTAAIVQNEEIRRRIERLGDEQPELQDVLHMILNVAEGKNWDGSEKPPEETPA